MFVIKAALSGPKAKTFAFSEQKTMYGGKAIAKGDVIFVFASENEGGSGLVASGIVTSAEATRKRPGIARQTPRVTITVRRTALAKRRLGRDELKRFSDWSDARPETELNFKLYRQATNKIAGISDEAAAFLRGFFDATGLGMATSAQQSTGVMPNPSLEPTRHGSTPRRASQLER
jgi:hypothetical protein